MCKNPQRFNPISALRKLGVLALVLSPLLLCNLPIFQSGTQSSDFCTKSDEVYQMIDANAEKWVAEFRVRAENPNILGARNLIITLPSGKETRVTAELWDIWNKDAQPIIAIIKQGYLNDRLGITGYIYAAEDNPPELAKITLKKLSPHIYCYYGTDS